MSSLLKATALAFPLGLGAAAGQAADVVAALEQDDRFETLARTIEAAGLIEPLKDAGPFTVFAPTDEAFDELPRGTLDRLLTEENRSRLEELLKHHVVLGEAYPADELPEQLEPMAGGPIAVGLAESGAVLQPGGGEQVAVTEGDIVADNGVIHAIDAVLVPRQLAQVLQVGQAQQQGQATQQQATQGQQQPAGQAAEAEDQDAYEFAGGQEAGPEEALDRIVDPAAIELPDGYSVEVFAQGLVYPTDITFGPNGEAYVTEAGGHFYGTDPAKAPPPRILRIKPDGSTEVVYDNAVPVEAIRDAQSYEEIPDGLIGPIEAVTYNPDNGLLYIAHRTRVSTLDPKTGEFKTLIDGLPAWGIFHNTKVIFDDQGRMIFGVSAQGNAGPVDFAIMKVISFYNKPGVREIPCEDVTLTGRDFSVENQFTEEKGDAKQTGAFVPYGTETEEGQTIEGQFWCNSALYRADADGSNPQRLAWGIRNAFHYEYGPDGRLVFTNNSCNPIPGRPVYDDWETIYALQEGAWYGWPDYCSSEPITLDRFKKPDDPQFKGEPFPHEFVLTEETRRRLLQGSEAPPPPLVKLDPHVAAQGFTFGRSDFGIPEDEILLAEFGAVIPYLVAGPKPAPGFRVSRVNLKTGQAQPFLANKSGQPASAAAGQPAPQGGGLERPLRLEYGPDGALYVVDFGVFDVAPKPKDAKTKQAFANTGVIWRVTRTAP